MGESADASTAAARRSSAVALLRPRLVEPLRRRISTLAIHPFQGGGALGLVYHPAVESRPNATREENPCPAIARPPKHPAPCSSYVVIASASTWPGRASGLGRWPVRSTRAGCRWPWPRRARSGLAAPFALHAYDVRGESLRTAAATASAVLVQGLTLAQYPFIAALETPLIIDLYDPFVLENLHARLDDSPSGRRRAAHDRPGRLGGPAAPRRLLPVRQRGAARLLAGLPDGPRQDQPGHLRRRPLPALPDRPGALRPADRASLARGGVRDAWRAARGRRAGAHPAVGRRHLGLVRSPDLAARRRARGRDPRGSAPGLPRYPDAQPLRAEADDGHARPRVVGRARAHGAGRTLQRGLGALRGAGRLAARGGRGRQRAPAPRRDALRLPAPAYWTPCGPACRCW